MSDLDKKRQLAESARDLKNDPAFQHAVLTLRKQWFAQMMATEPKPEHPGYLTALARHASMLSALEAIPLELQVIINDYTVSAKKNG